MKNPLLVEAKVQKSLWQVVTVEPFTGVNHCGYIIVSQAFETLEELQVIKIIESEGSS